MKKTATHVPTLTLSESQDYGVAHLPDGRKVLFGADLGRLLLVVTPGIPGVEVCLSSHDCETVKAFEECLERPQLSRRMTEDEMGLWEHAASLVRPCDTLLAGRPSE